MLLIRWEKPDKGYKRFDEVIAGEDFLHPFTLRIVNGRVGAKVGQTRVKVFDTESTLWDEVALVRQQRGKKHYQLAMSR